jgi:hypothetical protein
MPQSENVRIKPQDSNNRLTRAMTRRLGQVTKKLKRLKISKNKSVTVELALDALEEKLKGIL